MGEEINYAIYMDGKPLKLEEGIILIDTSNEGKPAIIYTPFDCSFELPVKMDNRTRYLLSYGSRWSAKGHVRWRMANRVWRNLNATR